MKYVFAMLITAYQKTLSPDHGLMRMFFPNGACRYHPTCSEYTKQAILTHGSLSGIRMGASRIARCRPSSVGGYDPITKSPS